MGLSKADKGMIKHYIAQMTKYSRTQVTRPISQYIHTGYVQEIPYDRVTNSQLYSDQDIKLLAQTDELHDFFNGTALKKILDSMSR